MKQYTQKQLKFITENFQNGQKAIQTGSFNQAEKYYLDILKVAPEIIEARNALAFIYTASQQHAKAISQLKTILKVNSNDANAHHNLANNLSEQQRYDEAINHYQIAIRTNPNLIDSYTQCGIAYRKLKNFELAFQYLNQALHLDNVNAKVLHALGVTYAEIEDYPHAIEHLKMAIPLAPNNMELNLHFAKVLEKAKFSHEADIQYHHTCSAFPKYLDAFLAYGDLLIKNRYYNAAIECYKHASMLAPDQLDILDDIANAYLSMADTDMAISKFSEALSKEPNRISSLIGVEQAYQDTGKLDEAINICDQIISLDSNNPVGYVLKSKVKKSKTDDGLAEALLRLSEKHELSDTLKLEIIFSLGKIFDDQNNYQQAFQFYAKANALKNQSLNYDSEETRTKFTQLIKVFNADFFNKYQHIGDESKLPILIVGMPRSGTTLTEQIISSHPDVLAGGEAHFWNDKVDSLPYTFNTQSDYPDCLNEILPAHAIDITKEYIPTLVKITGAGSMPKHITDKMPHNFLNIGLIAALFPNVKIIHTKRDPVDTCLSIYFQHFNDSHPYAYDLNNLGHYYQQYERIMQHWHTVLPGRIMDINYSDTVSDPEYWSRKLISYIGLEWDEACLAPHKLERSVRTFSHWQVRQPIYQTSVQRWKNYEEYLQPLIQALI